MRTTGRRLAKTLMIWSALALTGFPVAAEPPAAPRDSKATIDPALAKRRLIVLTDIGNEPDDSESMVRLLAYANEFDIEGLIAATSVWQRNKTQPPLIEERVRAYGTVLPNLRVHAAGYPSEQALLSVIRSGSSTYGMTGVGSGHDTPASQLIIEAVDRPDPRPVWVTIWGGAADLAQALWSVRAHRSPAAVARFVAKLRVYSISDQDDAGPWARQNFPELFWIASIHGFSSYTGASWTGLSNPDPGADPVPVSWAWVRDHVAKGALGALYPHPLTYIEGDTPSFLYLLANGLGDPEHPDWGSWGGRFGQLSGDLGLWTDVTDSVVGVDGNRHTDGMATIWRWRQTLQNDFAARMSWTTSQTFAGANHNPVAVLNGVPGSAPVFLTACPGGTVRLTATGSKDPDGQELSYRWWQYVEPTGVFPVVTAIEGADTAAARVKILSVPTDPKSPVTPNFKLHIILEVRDNAEPALTSYRRAVISVADTRSARGMKSCQVPVANGG